MSFLAPFFLVGALAISLPVLFHLARRVTRDRTAFGSLMFLLPNAPRLTRRSRLEHWLLLALRCLALGLLALGFARPFLKDASDALPLAAAPRHVVILLDTSASLRRAGLWDAVKAKAEAVLRSVAPTDHVALVSFARQTATLLSFSEWESTAPDSRVSLAIARLAAISPGWEGTQLGRALIAGADAFGDLARDRTGAGHKEIVLIGDVQAGSRLDALQAYEWPKDIALRVETVVPPRAGNAGVQLVAEAGKLNAQGRTVVRFRVANTADATTEQFALSWKRGNAEAVGTAVQVYVPPGQSRIVAMEVPADGAGIDRVELSGDAEAFDNTVYMAPPERQLIRVLYVGNEDPDNPAQPLFFLRRALESTSRVKVEVIARRTDAVLAPAELENVAIAFVTDAPGTESASVLRAMANAGKTVVVVPKSAAAVAALSRIVADVALASEEVKPATGGYAMWGEIDFKHPLFAAFADPRFADFTKIHVWKYRRLPAADLAGSRVVARFDSGDPAVVESTVGQGRVVWLTSGWQPEDSQLAVSSKFVPLIWSLLDHAGIVRAETTQFVVGDALPFEKLAVATEMRMPDGKTRPLLAGATSFAATGVPGIYRATVAGGETRFVVNLDPSETRTEPMSLDDLERLGVPAKTLGASAPSVGKDGKVPTLQAVETESRQKLWRWFLVATLAILLVESVLAGWTARRSPAKEQGVTS